jgi:hypothetical protein
MRPKEIRGTGAPQEFGEPAQHRLERTPARASEPTGLNIGIAHLTGVVENRQNAGHDSIKWEGMQMQGKEIPDRKRASAEEHHAEGGTDEQPPVQIAHGPGGRVGVVLGREEREGREYVNLDFGDYQSKIPASLFAESYTVTTSEKEHIDPEAVETYVREAEQERIKRLVHEKLIERIDEWNDYTAFRPELEFDDPALDEQVTTILEEASAGHYVFRGDAKQPFPDSGDMDKEAPSGIFAAGFIAKDEEDVAGIFTTPDLEKAIKYPESHNLLVEWTGSKYIYLIDPNGLSVTGDNSIFRPEAEVVADIETGSIDPHFVRYAIEMQAGTRKVLNVFKNDRYSR